MQYITVSIRTSSIDKSVPFARHRVPANTDQTVISTPQKQNPKVHRLDKYLRSHTRKRLAYPATYTTCALTPCRKAVNSLNDVH